MKRLAVALLVTGAETITYRLNIVGYLILAASKDSDLTNANSPAVFTSQAVIFPEHRPGQSNALGAGRPDALFSRHSLGLRRCR